MQTTFFIFSLVFLKLLIVTVAFFLGHPVHSKGAQKQNPSFPQSEELPLFLFSSVSDPPWKIGYHLANDIMDVISEV